VPLSEQEREAAIHSPNRAASRPECADHKG
jgi:hypothetical protein